MSKSKDSSKNFFHVKINQFVVKISKIPFALWHQIIIINAFAVKGGREMVMGCAKKFLAGNQCHTVGRNSSSVCIPGLSIPLPVPRRGWEWGGWARRAWRPWRGKTAAPTQETRTRKTEGFEGEAAAAIWKCIAFIGHNCSHVVWHIVMNRPYIWPHN